jgi:preprotein translocase subunit SecD
VRRRSLVASLLGIIVIALVALSATLIAGRSPLLGLDLEGGVSVVLQPQHKVSADVLQAAVNIIDRRVNGLGVANSTVERQGDDVVIELPGIKNSQNALKEIGTTAELFFRPVDCTVGSYVPPAKSSTSTTTPATPTTTKHSATTTKPTATTTKPTATTKTSATAAASGVTTGHRVRLTAQIRTAASTTTTAAPTTSTTTASSTTSSATTTKGSATTTKGSSTTVPSSTTTTAPAATTSKDSFAWLADYCSSGTAALPKGAPPSASDIPSTSPDNDNSYDTVIIPSSPTSGIPASTRWILGPSDLAGEIVKTASSALDTSNGEYVVNVTLTGSGLSKFNKIAEVRHQFYSSTATQQSFQSLEAIDLDGALESAPTIESAPFTGPIQISGSFTSSQASALATELRYGSLPVRFNTGNISTISATLGHSSLIAGLLAGLGGIVLVLLYMILYYRALGLVVVLGLAVGGSLLFAILTELSYTSSLALTLSGITGVIVSIGITVDSYVVYFERLKDEVRQGRTVRSSVERGFTRAFKTVLTADLVSFMAALILYLFTVGDVKGFAFTLGLSTLLDVFTAYFFIRPIVILLGRRRTTSETRFLGISRGLGAARPEGTP